MKKGGLVFLLFSSFFLKAQSGSTPDVVINEIMASNGTTQKDPNGDYDDWVELYNNTNLSIDLSNWFLSDEFSMRKKWKFPAGSFITAHGFLIVWCDSQLTQPGFHTPYKLNKGGEELLLCKPDTSIVDSITFGKQITDTTFARNPNGFGSFILSKPTFNAANSVVGGINAPGRFNELRLYPNPLSTKIMIAVEGILVIKVYNSVMQEVCILENSGPAGSFELDISNFLKGSYYLEVHTLEEKFLKKIILN